jgi:hypothetical protein
MSKLLAAAAFAASIFAAPAHAVLVSQQLNHSMGPDAQYTFSVAPGSSLQVTTDHTTGFLTILNSVSVDGLGWITVGGTPVSYGTAIPTQSGVPLNAFATVLDFANLFPIVGQQVSNANLGLIYLPFAFQPLPATLPLTPNYGYLTLDVTYLGIGIGYGVNVVNWAYDNAGGVVRAGVPEPESMALVAVALLALGIASRKKKQA